MPRLLINPCRPLYSPPTTPSLYLFTPPMSMPSNVVCTPNCSDSREESATSAACSSALVGMQPRCRQVPPTSAFSTRTTDRPSSAPRRAAAYPPLPAPRMTRSAVCSLMSASCVSAVSTSRLSPFRCFTPSPDVFCSVRSSQRSTVNPGVGCCHRQLLGQATDAHGRVWIRGMSEVHLGTVGRVAEYAGRGPQVRRATTRARPGARREDRDCGSVRSARQAATRDHAQRDLRTTCATSRTSFRPARASRATWSRGPR